MTNENKRSRMIQRINRWLAEPDGETFKDGKWRFWYAMLFALILACALLTIRIFDSSGPVVLAVGFLGAWLGVGALHYSDSKDKQLARGVSRLDSVTLCFAILHFCGLMWVDGHLGFLRRAEAKYEQAATAYNQKADKLSGDQVEIERERAKQASAQAAAAKEQAKAARFNNDTAYQLRRAGVARVGQFPAPAPASAPAPAPAPAVAPLELERPEKPEETPAAFLNRWDRWIRLANFGELILAAVTFIFIRNRSANTNSQALPQQPAVQTARLSGPTVQTSAPFRVSVQTQAAGSVQTLRDRLGIVSGLNPGVSFKVDARASKVYVRAMASGQGRQFTAASLSLPLAEAESLAALPEADCLRDLVGRFAAQQLQLNY